MEPFPPISLNHLRNKQTQNNNDISAIIVFLHKLIQKRERELDSSVSEWVICLVAIGNH